MKKGVSTINVSFSDCAFMKKGVSRNFSFSD
jgi:hypothetical protein